jgi:predicted acyl esterase
MQNRTDSLEAAKLGTGLVRYDDVGARVINNVLIPISDGIRLAADLYAPLSFDFATGSEPLPDVMEYIPYRKDDVGSSTRDQWYVGRPAAGYIFAQLDCRGTGGSEGSASDEYSPREQQDGAEAAEWLAAQCWCDPRVAMIGVSYGGFTSLQVASLAPDHLVAIVPLCFTGDRFADDCHYVSGFLRMYHDAGFSGTFMVAFNAMPPDRAAADLFWAEVWSSHLESNELSLLTWLRNQDRGRYWDNGSVGPIADRIACPVFMMTGWHDGYTNPPLRLCERLCAPRRVLIGPWDHAYPIMGIPGLRTEYLPHVAAGLHQYYRTDREVEPDGWPPVVVSMERYLSPDPNMLEPSGEWRADVSWPVPGAHEGTFHLVAGTLTDEPRADQATDELVYDPSAGVTTGLFSAGRIRLSIANADFPNVWPTPEHTATELRRGPGTPSRLVLSAVPAGIGRSAHLHALDHPCDRQLADGHRSLGGHRQPTWQHHSFGMRVHDGRRTIRLRVRGGPGLTGQRMRQRDVLTVKRHRRANRLHDRRGGDQYHEYVLPRDGRPRDGGTHIRSLILTHKERD